MGSQLCQFVSRDFWGGVSAQPKGESWTLAPGQIVKHRAGQRGVDVAIHSIHGSMRCAQRVLAQLGYSTPNTSAIERRHGTARRMNAQQVRRSLAVARREDTKPALGWWALTVYH
jgi:hypothetical protein